MNESVVLGGVDRRGVATVTLNRPAVNNAYNADLVQGLLDIVPALAADPAVRVIVLRGNGPHFQAGADLKWLQQIGRLGAAANHAVSTATAQVVRQLYECDKPTVALVHGACVGGGTGIVAACDVVVAERTATFAIAEARWGMAATIIFPELVVAMGLRQVRRYAQTCERFDATRAQALGLVHEVCDPGLLDVAAVPILDGLLAAGPDAIALSKRSATACAHAMIDDATFTRIVDEHAAKRRTPEAAEGLASFVEKRAARWNDPG